MAITLGGVLIAELIALAGANAYYKRKGLTIGQLGWSMPGNQAAVIGLSLVVAFLYSWYTMQIPEVRANVTEISLLKLWGLLVVVPAALIEEVIFRGYVMARLQQAKVTPMIQVLLTAAAFGLLHPDLDSWECYAPSLSGWLWEGCMFWANGVFWGPVLCHGIINATIEPWLFLWLLRFYSEKFAS